MDHPLVYVEWIDSAGFEGWQGEADVEELVPYSVRSIGLMIKETKKHIIIAQSETSGETDAHWKKTYHGCFSIPKCAITRRHDLHD